MTLLVTAGRYGMIGISAAGSAAHNMGQLLIAKIVLPALPFAGYAPVLIAAGLVTGAVVGLLCYEIYRRIQV